MNDQYNPQYMILVQYVDAAASLGESIEADIKNNKKISNNTVVALSKFIAASEKFKKGLEIVTAIKNEIN